MSRREQSPLQVSNLSKAVTCHCQRRDKLRGNWEFTLLMLAKHLGQSIGKVDNGKHFPAVTSGCSAQKKNYFGFQSLERTTTSAILIKNFLSTTKAIVHVMLPNLISKSSLDLVFCTEVLTSKCNAETCATS